MTNASSTRRTPRSVEHLEEGPWPFTTRMRIRRVGVDVRVLESRLHRKHLQRKHRREQVLRRSLTAFDDLNWWIGTVFSIGSALFILGSVLSMFPGIATSLSLDDQAVNAIFFLGSLPFTTAAYLQLYQSANAGYFAQPNAGHSGSIVYFGWRPRDIGWLSCALQFVGTLMFNINTFDAMLPGLDWWQQDLEIWAPNFAGSIFFLISGYLAFIEVCHAHWDWQPRSLSWWVTSVNLMGCCAFMASALFAFFPPGGPALDTLMISVAFTLVGAVSFLLGSLLLLAEAAVHAVH